MISFFVKGVPAPGGSKKFVGMNKKTGRALLVDAAGKRNKNWRKIVGIEGARAMGDKPLMRGPLAVTIVFQMPRPKHHFNRKGGFSKTATTRPTSKPDTLKLTRSTEDALTGIVWHDDAQVILMSLAKKWADENQEAGAYIQVHQISD